MFNPSQDFHLASSDRRNRPIVLFSLTNAFGVRLYSDAAPPSEALGMATAPKADGSLLAGGDARAGEGAMPLLDSGARVLSFGRLRETLTPFKGELAASLSEEEPGSVSLVLANGAGRDNKPFSRLEAMENLLGAMGELSVGYQGVLPREYLKRFKGRVWSYQLESDRLTLNLRAI